MMGVAVLLALRFPRWAAWALLALFLVQFALTDTIRKTQGGPDFLGAPTGVHQQLDGDAAVRAGRGCQPGQAS
jgi:hypothetical protein